MNIEQLRMLNNFASTDLDEWTLMYIRIVSNVDLVRNEGSR